MNEIYQKLATGYPLAEMSALLERHAERTGWLAVPQFYIVGDGQLPDGTVFPLSMRPYRYTADSALDDWKETPGSAISFIVRWFDPADADAMAEYQRHKDAQAAEREQMGLKP